MSRAIKFFPFYILIVSFTVACFHGQKFDHNQVKLIRQGITNQDEILEHFGAPLKIDREVVDGQYNVIWIYHYVDHRGEGARLIVRYDVQGLVKDYEYTVLHAAK